jgi:hypothetical protein
VTALAVLGGPSQFEEAAKAAAACGMPVIWGDNEGGSPSIPAGVRILRVDVRGESRVRSVNRCLAAAESDCLVIAGSESSRQVAAMATVVSSIVPSLFRPASVSPAAGEGWSACDRNPVAPCWYSREAFRAAGFLPEVRDASVAAWEWADSARRKGFQHYRCGGGLDASQGFESPPDWGIARPSRRSSLAVAIVSSMTSPYEAVCVRQVVAAARLWSLQDGSPAVLVVDAGSSKAYMRATAEALEGIAEVASIGSAQASPAESVAAAWSLAWSVCRQQSLVLAHDDAFPVHRGVLREVISLLSEAFPATGYEEESFPGRIWGMLAAFDLRRMDGMGIMPSPRRWGEVGHADHRIAVKTGMPFPGLEARLAGGWRRLGSAPRGRRWVGPHVDHGGGWQRAILAGVRPEKAVSWAEASLVDAERRAAEWEAT